MSHLSPLIPRTRSKASIAASDTTYHSFRTAEQGELEGSPTLPEKVDPSNGREIVRRDSGYESATHSRSGRRRNSSTSTLANPYRHRIRGTVRRLQASGPVAYLPRASDVSLYATRSHQYGAPFFHFPRYQDPSLGPTSVDFAVTPNNYGHPSSTFPSVTPPPRIETPTYPLPPQTTHYWTSDRTRRLEYAAIDAASRGFRGWMRRHMVPECFVPKEHRHLSFEEDGGSVVRYRLDLETEESGEKEKRKSWWNPVRCG
jgi:hypothetical protein